MGRTAAILALVLASAQGSAWGVSASSYDIDSLPGAGALNHTMAVGDFDGDDNMDLVSSCVFPPRSLNLYFGDGNGAFSSPVTLSEDHSARVFAAHLDADEHPDIIGLEFADGDLSLFINNGDGSFGAPTEIPGSTSWAMGITMGFFDGDEHLDLVVFGSPTRFYRGNGLGGLTAPTYVAGSSNGGGGLDCNADGALDLVLFDGHYVRLYLGNGAGGFALSDTDTLSVLFSYASSHGPQAILGEGIVDFNEDGTPDILVAEPLAPSEGPSHAHVLFTDGSGHFTTKTTVSVLGRCEGLTALDYDYDGHLDIAAGSSVENRIHVFFGDGSGGITDSVSFSAGSAGAICLYAADFKEDGLWDFVAGDVEGGATVLTDLAPTPAPIVVGGMELRASRTVRLSVSNPRDLTVEDLGYHIPSAKIHRRDADFDGTIEDVFKDVTLHDGDYIAQVYPAASAAPGATYSLTAEIAGVPLQFARNAIIPQAGNTYPILVYTGTTPRVTPQTGSFTPNTTPTFDWSHDSYKYPQGTTYTLQIDDNYDFSSPVYSVPGLAEPGHTVSAPLLTDTLFYWRYITDYDGVGEYSTVFAINITNCSCPLQADFDANAGVDALDLARLIDVVFFGAPDQQDVTCPSPRGDVNCSGLSDAVDLAETVDHVFFGGAGPCNPCD